MKRDDLPDCPHCRGRVVKFHMLYDRDHWPRSEWVYFCKHCGKLDGATIREIHRREALGDIVTPLH